MTIIRRTPEEREAFIDGMKTVALLMKRQIERGSSLEDTYAQLKTIIELTESTIRQD